MPHSRPSRFNAVRSPVRIARAGPSSSATRTGTSVTCAPSSSSGASETDGSSAWNTARAAGIARDHAGLLEDELGPAAQTGRNDPVGRQIARADVLGERGPHDRVECCGAQLHRSIVGS